MDHRLRCIECGAQYSSDRIIYRCERCDDLLEVCVNYEPLRDVQLREEWRRRDFNAWRYRELLPISIAPVTLGEGGTSLLKCKNFAKKHGLKDLYVKNEGQNPTASFKDRGMTVGLSKAVELGAIKVACASTGNTSASVAAYAARGGLECIVIVPQGKIASGKLAQALIYGAKVLQVRGNFDDALRLVIQLTEAHSDIYLLNSINPYRIEGQKTVSYEICDQLRWEPPDWIVVPVGNAGNISSIWKGLVELRELSLIDKLPRLVGVQAAGAAPIATAFKRGNSSITSISSPQTVASAIRIGSPVSWKKALRAIKESNGLMEVVTDEEILSAQKEFARSDGLFIEPASAASIAALGKLVKESQIAEDEVTVCVATGHGLKDPDIAMKGALNSVDVDANLSSIEKAIGI